MTPITILLQALVAGALAQPGQPYPTVKRAYQTLRKYLQQHYPTDSLALLEKRPDSPARREALREELEGTGADQDNKLLELAHSLIAALLAYPATEGSQAVAVDLEEVQAALIQLRQIRSSGTAVKMKRVRAEKIVADDLSVGEGGGRLSGGVQSVTD